MTARSSVSREHMVALGRLGGLVGGKARAAKYTPEQLRQIHANQMRTRFATPEQVSEFQRKAAQGRWGKTAEERSRVASELNARRWGKVAYAKNKEKTDRLYSFLREYISAKRYAPTMVEISRAVHQSATTARRLLQVLERIGWIQQHAWGRGGVGIGITLISAVAQPQAVAPSLGEEAAEPELVPPSFAPRQRKCYDCNEPAVEGKTRCEQHLQQVRSVSKRSHTKAYSQKRRVGICVTCAKPAVAGKARCELHLRLNRTQKHALTIKCTKASSPECSG